MSARRRGAIGCLCVLATLVVAELGARALGPRLAWRPQPPFGRGAVRDEWLARSERELAEGRPPPGYSRFDAELGWTAQPGYASPAGDIHIDARGLRSLHEYADAPADGTRRVIACGESFTFGEEVRDAEAWCARMEVLEPALEVWNLGVGGYGTDQALLRVTKEGRGPAAALLVGFMLENIGRNVNRYRPLWYPSSQPAAKPRFVAGAGGLEPVPQPYATREEFTAAVRSSAVFTDLAEHEFWRASPVPEWMLTSRLVQLVAGRVGYAERALPPLYADTDGEPFRTSLALLEAFRPVATSLGGAQLLVLVFPMKSDLAGLVSSGKRTWEPLLTALDARGLAFLDLSEALLPEARAHGVDELYLESHFSPLANDLVARAVLARLGR